MNEVLAYWTWDGSSLMIVISLMAVYIWVNGPAITKKQVLFFLALLLLIICLFSPLRILSTHYLFSAHMIVHVALLLLIGPLLLLSLPANAFGSFFSFLHKHPFTGWITGVGIMWFWHIPAVFNSSMGNGSHGNDGTGIIETLSLLVAGIIFSAPVIHPDKEKRIHALSGVVYLFTACIGCSVLGILISFAETGIYHHYLSMHDAYNINQMITRQWKISQRTDQQIAGLIMWVPCCLLYVSGIMYLLFNWFNEKEAGKESYLVN